MAYWCAWDPPPFLFLLPRRLSFPSPIKAAFIIPSLLGSVGPGGPDRIASGSRFGAEEEQLCLG